MRPGYDIAKDHGDARIFGEDSFEFLKPIWSNLTVIIRNQHTFSLR